MRKLFVSADMEGCGPVSSHHALLPERWEWTAARRWMTDDVIAVAEVALAQGYDEVIVADSHGNGHNIDPDLLPDNVRLVRSWPRPLLHMQGVEDVDVTACAFIGYHAGSTTTGGIMAHSFSGSAIRAVRIDGRDCSEGYVGAAVAGELGRAVLFVSGDEQTVKDAGLYAAAGFVTKHAIGWRSQMSLPPSQVRLQLKNALSKALDQPAPRPFTLKGPHHLELEMTTQTAAELLAYLPRVERVGPWSVRTSFDSATELLRFIAFSVFYSPAGIIPH